MQKEVHAFMSVSDVRTVVWVPTLRNKDQNAESPVEAFSRNHLLLPANLSEGYALPNAETPIVRTEYPKPGTCELCYLDFRTERGHGNAVLLTELGCLPGIEAPREIKIKKMRKVTNSSIITRLSGVFNQADIPVLHGFEPEEDPTLIAYATLIASCPGHMLFMMSR